MSLADEGLLLGVRVVLAKWSGEGLRIEEDRILTLLLVAYKGEVPQATIAAIDRASKHWRAGDKALATIHLAQIGLRKLSEEDGERLKLAAALLDTGMSARKLAQELGLNIQPHIRKYDDTQPRVPAGNGRASVQWTSSGTANADPALSEGRSASTNSGPVERERDLPKNAIVVTRPDGFSIDDPKSPTGKLMAPPHANFQDVYAAGEKISAKPLLDQYGPAHDALRQFRIYDYQRDKATNTFFDHYIHAANYAVGVYMAGTGHSLLFTLTAARAYALRNSSNAYKDDSREWTIKGWSDGRAGVWKRRH